MQFRLLYQDLYTSVKTNARSLYMKAVVNRCVDLYV